jgi:hypothetical protein
VVDWRVDCAMLPFRVTPKMCQQRILAIIPWPTVTLHKVHSAALALLRDRHAFASLNIIIIFALLPSTTRKCAACNHQLTSRES